MKSTLPAYPLLTSDPYISVWSRTEHPAKSDTTHWSGPRKRLTVTADVDGETFALVGRPTAPEAVVAELVEREVTATATIYTFRMDELTLSVAFRAPLLLDDLDLASTPITFVQYKARWKKGVKHRRATITLEWHDDICRDGAAVEPMAGGSHGEIPAGNSLSLAWMGKKRQPMLCHSADHATIDWGYAYMLADIADSAVGFQRVGGHWALTCFTRLDSRDTTEATLLLGYDDVASIDYFGYIAKAWYARNGQTLPDAMVARFLDRKALFRRMEKFDAQLEADALAAGGEAYRAVAIAAYRHSIAAHKLVADREGNVVFLSKENDSNGCIGTVDVSYPSIPLYLLYNPELVRGMCRPVFKFAKLPAWNFDFAPHDVGRYPHATGQVYGLSQMESLDTEVCDPTGATDVYPPVYLYGRKRGLFVERMQMPVEESGNMILMMAAALKADGDDALVRENLPLLSQWVKYLEKYGADPGEQLCTDDFAGHLAHNVNLAFKAVCGLAAYAYIVKRLGDQAQADHYAKAAKEMAKKVVKAARNGNGTGLTMDGQGWSLKYNAVWDVLFNFGLFDKKFFADEIKRYRQETNAYGVPLDSRKAYTKSDWILWAVTFSQDPAVVDEFCKPLVKFFAETPTKVPFSDWFDTKTGAYMHFIARSVQGGLFMPMLHKKWKNS